VAGFEIVLMYSGSNVLVATWLNGSSGVIRIRERGPYTRKCTTIYDHEEVCHQLRVLLLPYVLTVSSPDVEFCGYSIPHPSEEVMNLRIQTWGKNVSP
jgi:hypothetical protein